jgi:hypothetical protein
VNRRKRIAALEAEVRILAGELETQRLLIDRLTADPEKVAGTLTDALVRARDRAFTTVPPEDDDLPPGVISVAELMTAGEYAAIDEELWGKWDAPTVTYTKAEEAAFAEIVSEYADGGK